MSIMIKWFPRSWVQLRWRDINIYVDPSYLPTYFINYPARIGKGDMGLPEKLPFGDILLFTHAHKDHCKISTANLIRNEKTAVFAPESCKNELCFEYTVVKPNEQYESHGVNIQTRHMYNTPLGRSTKKVHKKGIGTSYIISIGGFRIYHAGDTDFIPEMADINDIDIAFLPVGGTYTMDLEEAVEAIKCINPKLAIPIHCLDADLSRIHSCFSCDLTNTQIRILSIGEEFMYR